MDEDSHELKQATIMVQAHVEMLKKYCGEYIMAPAEDPEQNLENQESSESRNVDSAVSLAELTKQSVDCRKCRLAEGRTQVVFGCGSPTADLVIVGEAPGYHEDKQGIPFVGDAGQLLTKMLAAINIRREDAYICNVIKCRPPKNRDPESDELLACRYWFTQQLQLLQPKLLFAVGRFAARILSGETQSMWKYRGQTYYYEGIPVFCSYHPAYLLRNPADKTKAWQDLKRARKYLDGQEL